MYQRRDDRLPPQTRVKGVGVQQQYNKRKGKKEKWMTNELLKQINKKNYMYIDWKTKSTTTEMCNNKNI